MRKFYSILMTISIVSLLVFGGGFLWGVRDLMQTGASALPKLPVKPSDLVQNQLNITALGDSLTRGIGDADGVGYVGVLRKSLVGGTAKTIQVTNLGVSGATSTDLLAQLTNKGSLRTVALADTIVMTIGGNDLFNGGRNLEEINLETIGKGREKYLANLKKIFSILRTANASAPIYLLGLYNPFGDLKQADVTTRVVNEWNFQTQLLAAAYSNVIFVPTADIFQRNMKALLYNDHFHPNHEGYARIGARLIALIQPSLLPETGGERP